MTKLSKKECIKRIVEKLNRLAYSGDREMAHAEADDLLCEVVDLLGHGEVTHAYSQISKWYA